MVKINYHLNFLMFYLCIRSNSQNLKQMYSVRLPYAITLNVILLAIPWSPYVGRHLSVCGHGLLEVTAHARIPALRPRGRSPGCSGHQASII